MYDNSVGDRHPRAITPMVETQCERRGHAFLPPSEVLATLPGRYDQEEVPEEHAVVYLHYFMGEAPWRAQWWVVELWEDTETPARWDAFGFSAPSPEVRPYWSRVNLTDLERLSVPVPPNPSDPIQHLHHLAGARIYVQRDLTWTPRPAHECVPGLATGGV